MRLFALLIVAISLLVTPAVAQLPSTSAAYSEPVETERAKSWLVSEKAAISPGETITVAFYQELLEGWHVYWQNPGDSGLPLELGWTLPEGFSAGAIQYPIPHTLPLGPLVNYGHEGTPAFLVEIDVPQSAEPGTEVLFQVQADWLICADICVPEAGALELSLPVVEAPAAVDSTAAPLFAEARKHLPLAQAADAEWFDLDGAPALVISAGFVTAADDLYFFEGKGGIINPSAPQRIEVVGEEAYFVFVPGYEYAADKVGDLTGLVGWKQSGSYQGMMITAPAGDAAPAALLALAAAPEVSEVTETAPEENGQVTAPASAGVGLWAIFGMSLLGGIILNIMPCVFPVIFLKAAKLAASAHKDRATVVRHGLLYTAGILITFTIMAGLLMGLRAGGEEIGWGFHLQSPVTVGFFAVVILLVGLNLAGVFEIGTSVQGLGSGLAAQEGNAGAFFTGLLAVAVAAPCIGPFLGVPVGYALSAPTWVGFMVFALIGLGLALPYLTISLVPGLAKVLPKPGAWMETFKQLLSFAMFATLIWLIWTLTLQAGTGGLVLLLIALLLVGFAAWAFGKTQGSSGGWMVFSRVLALAALIGAAWVIVDITPQTRPVAAVNDTTDLSALPEMTYSEALLEELRAQGRPVFVDFTAAWCVTCQFNKQTVLKRAPVIAAFHEKNVVYMVADWTVRDPEITRALEAQGRSGVPLYLFYAPGAEKPQVLPQTLSIDLMLNTFSAL